MHLPLGLLGLCLFCTANLALLLASSVTINAENYNAK